MTAQDTLRKAADIIEQEGWTTRKDVAVDGSGLCANGAIRRALGHEVCTNSVGAAFLASPLHWKEEDFNDFRRGLMLAVDTADAFLATKGVTISDEAKHLLPAIVYFNDTIAPDGKSVAEALRSAADWQDQQVLDQVAQITDTELVPA